MLLFVSDLFFFIFRSLIWVLLYLACFHFTCSFRSSHTDWVVFRSVCVFPVLGLRLMEKWLLWEFALKGWRLVFLEPTTLSIHMSLPSGGSIVKPQVCGSRDTYPGHSKPRLGWKKGQFWANDTIYRKECHRTQGKSEQLLSM